MFSRFILRRLILAIPMLLGITLVLFIIYNLVQVDPLVMIVGERAMDKPEIVALSKADALDPDTLKQQKERLRRAARRTPLVLSAASGKGLPEALRARLGAEIVAIYHSHPESPAYPSATDVELAFWPEAVYLICSLADPSQPTIRAFRIRDGAIAEVALSN